MTFESYHRGIDAHVVSAHGLSLDGTTKQEKYADFQRRFPRPWPFATDEELTARYFQVARSPHPLSTPSSNFDLGAADYIHSTYREKLVEHIFISEVLQEAWVRHRCAIEVLRSEIDAGGFDLVLTTGAITRHVQLKSTRCVIRGKVNTDSDGK